MYPKKKQVDTLFVNAKIVNVFTEEIIEQNVAVKDGFFYGFDDCSDNNFKAENSIDLKGMYMVPGLIDAHVHIESSMTIPENFGKAVLSYGTTTCIADPHEIANVAGLDGIKYMINSANNTEMNILFALPSCVPSTHMETSGAILDAAKLETMINHHKVVALAEMMNYPGVIFQDPDVMAKIKLAKDARKPIDGHAPNVTGNDLALYAGAGILSDHECTNPSEANEKIRLGMHIMIREGTCAKNLDDLFPAINNKTYNRMMWCTDDRHPEEILTEGHVDHIVRKAIKKGLDPIWAIKMGTINPANYFNIHDVGAIAPGRRADFILTQNLEEFKVNKVFVKGVLVEDREAIESDKAILSYPKVMNIKKDEVDFSIPSKSSNIKIRVIEAIPDQVVTGEKIVTPKLENGFLIPDTERDILKIAVVERYSGKARTGKGFVKGINLKKGAIASSVAHDSHNIIVVGTNDRDMRIAFEKVVDMKGGFCVSKDGEILEFLDLPVAGLMSDRSLKEVDNDMKKILKAVRLLGSELKDPFMTLGFLGLPVIPNLKITDHGIVDVEKFEIVDLIVKDE
ncbi:MAG: adenine deaminase [Desulfobacteraceae bacterium]|nr:adenine deaminase [Desulfobacteraceae bacterium]